MADELIKNVSVHISSRSFLNITFNIFQCGNCDVENGFQFTTTEDGVYQLFYLNSGDGYLKTDSYTSKIRANSGFFIFPDVRYTFTAGCVGTCEIALGCLLYTLGTGPQTRGWYV